jgi:dipeptidyl aminopeptidase/acylaminoacyl peptidase
MPRRTPITAEDIYQLRQPLQCRLSPKGDQLITTVTQPEKEAWKSFTHLWLVDLAPWMQRTAAAGSAPGAGREDGHAEVRQFTQGKSSEQNPRWSPDGSTIAFLSNRSGKQELWAIPAKGGEARQVTTMKGNISEFEWHPGGKRLVVAFTPQDAEAKEREEKKKRGDPGSEAPRVREIRRLFYKLDGAGFLPEGRTHLFLVNAETGKARPLTTDDHFDEAEPRFSPDGKWLYFVSNRTSDPDLYFQRIDIWRMPAGGGTIEKVRNFDGPSYNFSFSPDGKWIAFLGTPDPKAPWNQHHIKLWITPVEGGRPRELTEKLDRSCENTTISDTFGTASTNPPLWSPDGASVYFVVSNEGNSEVWRMNLKGNRPEPVLNAPGAVIDFAIDFRNGLIHSAWSDAGNPGEIRTDPLPGGRGAAAKKSATHTQFNSEWLSRRLIANAEEFWFEGPGRHRLQGWILHPRRALRPRRHPAILYIHGGPATQYGRIFFHEFQYLAARGYTVFYCNPRGGTGYAERHLNAIVNRWGTLDYDDLMAFTDEALRRAKQVDRRRVAVGGGSYGGYMTNWIIGHTDRFACAVTSRSISNLMSFVGSSDFGYAWPQEFGSLGPWEDPRHYLKMSPLTYLSRMKTPTLIEHQEEDHRCPIEQAEQLWAALKVKGVPVEFARYPGEPHGMSRGGRPDRRVDRLERIQAWLEKWTRR